MNPRVLTQAQKLARAAETEKTIQYWSEALVAYAERILKEAAR